MTCDLLTLSLLEHGDFHPHPVVSNSSPANTRHSNNVDLMLGHAGPTLNQDCLNVSCSLVEIHNMVVNVSVSFLYRTTINMISCNGFIANVVYNLYFIL